jgi:hypothetical protein
VCHELNTYSKNHENKKNKIPAAYSSKLTSSPAASGQSFCNTPANSHKAVPINITKMLYGKILKLVKAIPIIQRVVPAHFKGISFLLCTLFIFVISCLAPLERIELPPAGLEDLRLYPIAGAMFFGGRRRNRTPTGITSTTGFKPACQPFGGAFLVFGAGGGNRTPNLRIKSPLLCQLSYTRIIWYRR